MTATTEARIGPLTLLGTRVGELWEKGHYPENGYSLHEVMAAYHNLSTGFRDDVHANYGKGFWLPDVVDSTKATKGENGVLIVEYMIKPRLGTHVIAVDGEMCTVKWPRPGYRVPDKDGRLFDPTTGVALATETDLLKARALVAQHIQNNPEIYKGWQIPEAWKVELVESFDDFNSKTHMQNPLPEHLAYIETAWQGRPPAGYLSFLYLDSLRRGCRALDLYWCGYPGTYDGDLGARLRSKE